MEILAFCTLQHWLQYNNSRTVKTCLHKPPLELGEAKKMGVGPLLEDRGKGNGTFDSNSRASGFLEKRSISSTWPLICLLVQAMDLVIHVFRQCAHLPELRASDLDYM